MNIIEQKKVHRQSISNKRDLLSEDIKSKYDQWICSSLEKMILENDYKVIHTYLPMGSEIDLFPLIEKLLKLNLTIVCPKVKAKRTLENLVLNSLSELEEGKYGTQHPAKASVYNGNYDMIIVPGLAYDKEKYRLGYGGGFYDIFLSQHPESSKIGAFYPFQELDQVPRESHDIKFDMILSKEF